jgi:aquaporin Z
VAKYIVELIGTFFLVLTIGMTVIEPGGAGVLAPVAIGAMLATMVYAGGHVSGAHYNPAVTLAAWLRGACEASVIPGYLAAQFAGAASAGWCVLALKGFPPTIVARDHDIAMSLVAESFGTFALVWVILNVATAPGTKGNDFYGLAIGIVVTALAYSLGPISGGAFNPGVALGVTVMGLGSVADIWIYLVPQVLGGAAAALSFNALGLADEPPTES